MARNGKSAVTTGVEKSVKTVVKVTEAPELRPVVSRLFETCKKLLGAFDRHPYDVSYGLLTRTFESPRGDIEVRFGASLVDLCHGGPRWFELWVSFKGSLDKALIQISRDEVHMRCTPYTEKSLREFLGAALKVTHSALLEAIFG